MRKALIAGNWKMYKTPTEAAQLAGELKAKLSGVTKVDALVCPPFISIPAVRELLTQSNVKVGAQNVYWEAEGAFTGEISPKMLQDAGCDYVIIGHSERRHIFGESNEQVKKKTKAVIAAGMKAIVCVGELLAEREQNRTEAVLDDQVTNSLIGIGAADFAQIVIAYEPVWAIGTGKTATPDQAQDAHKYIRTLLKRLQGEKVAAETIIQYGGSVKPDNIKELMAQPDVDGALVGGASLKADSFEKLVKYYE